VKSRLARKLDKIPANIGIAQCAAIMTGAPMPSGADAVVMVEYSSQRGKHVKLNRGVSSGANVVAVGGGAPRSVLVDRGQRLTEAALALAASVGKSRVQV